MTKLKIQKEKKGVIDVWKNRIFAFCSDVTLMANVCRLKKKVSFELKVALEIHY